MGKDTGSGGGSSGGGTRGGSGGKGKQSFVGYSMGVPGSNNYDSGTFFRFNYLIQPLNGCMLRNDFRTLEWEEVVDLQSVLYSI